MSKMIWQQLRNYSLRVGDKVSVKRIITSKDVQLFADITKDHNPIHSDPKKGVVHGALLNGLVSGVIGTALPGFGTVVVQQELRFPKPCYVGDEVSIDVTIKSVRKIIEVEFFVFSKEGQDEQVFLEGSAKLLLPFHENFPKSRQEQNSYGHDYIKN